MVTDNRITPELVETLGEGEIFVFGCRNSGRHFDGASNFALEHFGAIMGQREGRQGQSYAIPTIGGTIGLRDIRKSVTTFTQYAAEHPELHFLVTPIGCGGGCRSKWDIAPMFNETSKLPNVSLPLCFWHVLKLQNIKRPSIFYSPKSLYKKLMAEVKYGDKDYYWRFVSNLPLIICFKRKNSLQTYLVNCEKEQVVEMINKEGEVKIFSHEDIAFQTFNDISVKEQLSHLQAPHGVCVWGFNHEGISLVRWGVGGVDKFNCPNMYADGYINTDFQVLIPFQSMDNPFDSNYYKIASQKEQQIHNKTSIWK